MKALTLTAWSRLDCELTHAEASQIRDCGLVEVAAQPAPDRWRLLGKSLVGVASGPTWELRVLPRLEVSQLLFLLGYAADPSGWKDRQADFAVAPDLFDAIANGFSWHALRLVEQGLLRGYMPVRERLPALRGRIRFGDQIARSAGMPLPVEVTYDDYTADIAENRALKAAAAVLLRLPRVPPLARRRLLRLRELLDEVATLAPAEVEIPAPTRLNKAYRPALRLAGLILQARSLGIAAGSFSSLAFAFDMNRVFEDFLSVALRESMRRYGGEVRFQPPAVLDRAGAVAMRPDLTWRAGGRERAVIDAKHKDLGRSGLPPEDIYQMLAYCTALRLGRGYLVYAKDGDELAGEIEVRNADCRICVRALDLEHDPVRLLEAVERLAAEVAGEAAVLPGELSLVV